MRTCTLAMCVALLSALDLVVRAQDTLASKPRHENALGFGLDATLMQKKVAPVRVGFELGTRVGLLKQETWTLATARLAFHY